jgi:divalent metal cation (Fe/Co/Zn/Cd) transporter
VTAIPITPAALTRAESVRRAFLLEVLTVSWNLIEGVIAVAAGLVAGSVALVGFGVDSFIETASGAVVGYRMYAEMSGAAGGEKIERLEQTTSRIAGVLLLALAAYILIDAGARLLGYGARAEETLVGIALTAVSLIVMPILGRAKLRAAREIGSGALRADAYETITCTWLSLTTLVGLLLNWSLGWWWADPLAALVLVPLLVREGREALRGEHCGCH